jgi:hypothetical protein
VLGEEGLVVTDVEAVCGVCAVAMLTEGGGVAGFMQPVVEIRSTGVYMCGNCSKVDEWGMKRVELLD